MVNQQLNYQRIARAIDYLNEYHRQQPSLNEIARAIGMSPYHFQRTFTEWAGVSPKKFLQYLTLEYAKKRLRQDRATLLETAHETGLSGSARLHDLFINVEAMTPGEFKSGGQRVAINYSFSETPFGKALLASTDKGICYLGFEESETQGVLDLKDRYPFAQFIQRRDQIQQSAISVFDRQPSQADRIKLHLYGTSFQLKVWQALLTIPLGGLDSYGHLAQKIDHPKASRAVGSAVGKNPVAFLIPCHRVIQASGHIGGYLWGATRKSAILGWEASQVEAADGLV